MNNTEEAILRMKGTEEDAQDVLVAGEEDEDQEIKWMRDRRGSKSNWRGRSRGYGSQNGLHRGYIRKRRSACRICGEEDHWAYQCPENVKRKRQVDDYVGYSHQTASDEEIFADLFHEKKLTRFVLPH